MPRGRSQSRARGAGRRGEDSQVLSKRRSSKSTQSDILLRGLELLSEYYSLGLDQPPLKDELKNLETEAISHAEALRQDTNREEAIGLMARELVNIEKILDNYRGRPNSLIQILLDIQSQNNWLSKPALRWVAARLDIPWSRIYHIATFYKVFSLKPQGRHVVQVCLGTACQVRGARRLLDNVMDVLKIMPGETDSEQKFTLTTVNCLGCCALGPVMVVDDVYYSKPTLPEIKRIVARRK